MTRSLTGSQHPLRLPSDVATGGLPELTANHGLMQVVFAVIAKLRGICGTTFEIHAGASVEKDSDRHQKDAETYGNPCPVLPKRSNCPVLQLFRSLVREESFATELLHALPLFRREVFIHLLDRFEGISLSHIDTSADLNFIRKLRLHIPQSGESLVRSC